MGREQVLAGVLRQVKDEEEIACIRRACSFADKAFEDIVHFIRPGRTELEVAARLEQAMREAGSEKPSFDTIVASGLRGSMPHGTATEKVIEAGDFVTMDYGAKYQGYCSDITRTVCVGEATARQREVYGAVLGAQELVLSLIAPGKSGKEIDAASREFLKKYDLAQYFGHGLGHSLGLEIHEEPRLSPSSTCEHLVPGMLITDEPGVYESGVVGIRIENELECYHKADNQYGTFLAFRPLTFVPIATSPVVPGILTKDEIEWLNAYHREVFTKLAPRLTEEERDWLAKKCAAIGA